MAYIEVYTDGAARGNPGPSASGFSVYEGKDLVKEHVFYNGRRTNNFAEYMAMIEALAWCKAHFSKNTAIQVVSDSKLVVNQASGAYKTKSSELGRLNRELKALCGHFLAVEFKSVPRSNALIKRVDRRLNQFLDSRE